MSVETAINAFLRRLPEWARTPTTKIVRGAQADSYLAGVEHACANQRAFLDRHPALRDHYMRETLAEVNDGN